MTVREQMQAGLEDYDLKTDEELVDIITNFGCGETEFHTADVERLIRELQHSKDVIKILQGR
jgi:hypothetical protein